MIIILVGMTVKNKIAITLDQELIEFLDNQATNRSEYLNTLLAEQRSKILRQQMIAALQEDLADPDHQAEIAAWDVVIGDGLNAEG
jgi:metal-responsive CopG/Arc/MetJ family transcriptional regulator